ncbi:MAG: HAMP domain-containing sensor histidine kinase [Solirubrobacterales bacterium]
MNNRRFRWGIREKLTLLFFAVTLIAVTVNFLIVVPRLELRLRNDRLNSTKTTAARLNNTVQQTFQNYDPGLAPGAGTGSVWQGALGQAASSSGDRVAILRYQEQLNPLDPARFLVVWDPSGETPADATTLIPDPVAARAVSTGETTSGFTDFGSGLHAETAVPLVATDGTRVGAAVYTTSLTGVTATVRQVARRQLFSAIIALSIALVAGLMASSYMARRLRRLETAARKVAGGDFTEPLVVDSEDEIGEVARAFNTMQDRLGRADRARKAFIANASHELRTPLFSLGGYVELMREEELDEETQREFLDQMHVQIKRMTKLATDLLDVSKIDTGSLAIQPQHVNLASLARSVVREFEPAALQHESELSVDAEDDVEAICDPDRVAQITRILVDNALSHTPSGTNIEIAMDSDSDGVVMRVSDNGPGIPAEDIGRIFDRFHTGDKTGGTGLGLAIARDLATAMQGSLNVDTDGSGTCFTLRLPAGVKINTP